jgi:predicted DsbA family dithiol-disulfide isomerase/uncharacterized membrane protein
VRARLPLLGLRLTALIALAVSTALLCDYARTVTAFCTAGSGCDAVKTSGYGTLVGVPVPVFGALGFALLFALTFFSRMRRVVRAGALAAGLCGLGFLVLQAFVIHAFCKLCVVVDVAAIAAAVCAAVGWPSSDAKRWPLAAWCSTAALSIALPLAGAWLAPRAPAPPVIRELWAPGKLNVVEFADFECPFCRLLHPTLSTLLAEHGERVHFVRLNMPLAQHLHARDAARAYLCADAQGMGAKMADLLFEAKALAPADCERIATFAGISMPQYVKCMAGSDIDIRIDDQMRRVREAGMHGLPTLWIGDERIVGAAPADEIRSALERAAHGRHRWSVSAAWIWALLTLCLVGACAVALHFDKKQ